MTKPGKVPPERQVELLEQGYKKGAPRTKRM